MDKLNLKKIIGISVILIVIVSISILTYGRNKSKVFKDEYMNNIFIEEDTLELEGVDKDGSNNEYIIVVEIKGEVLRPDVYELNEGSIVKDLIEAAGGLTSEADISNINRAKEVKNHELVIIRNINDVSNIEEHDDIIEIEKENDVVISINDADISKLKEIPGIGDVKANSIIMYREKNGGFKSIEELKNVDGIGEKTFEKIKDSIKL